MTSRFTRFILVVLLALIALPPRADAQFGTMDVAAPDAFFVSFENPGNTPKNIPDASAPIGACWIIAPAWPDVLLVDCQIDGTPTALQVWKGQPVAGGVPAAVLPYFGGPLSVQNPTAKLPHLMEEDMLFLEVLGANGSLGQGQIARPQQQSFARVTLNGAGHQPPNPTTATGSCDLLLMTPSEQFRLFARGFFDCEHNVPNAQFGQIRRDSPNGPVILDFSDQLPNPMQRGIFPIPDGIESLLGDDLHVSSTSRSPTRVSPVGPAA